LWLNSLANQSRILLMLSATLSGGAVQHVCLLDDCVCPGTHPRIIPVSWLRRRFLSVDIVSPEFIGSELKLWRGI